MKHRLLSRCVTSTLEACYRNHLELTKLTQEEYPFDMYVQDVKKHLKFSSKDIKKGVEENI